MLYYTIIYYTRSLGRSMPLLLAPIESWGALRALLGAFSPLLNSSIQKYTSRWSFGHLELQNLSIISDRDRHRARMVLEQEEEQQQQQQEYSSIRECDKETSTIVLWDFIISGKLKKYTEVE